MVKSNIRRQPRRNLIQRMLAPLGEISVLRNSWPSGWGFQYMTPYRLDSSRVDYSLARQIYRNTADKYKLGAGFAKPVINTTAGFMGAPHFIHPDPDADQGLERAMTRWTGKVLRIDCNALRDGDVFVRIARVPDRFNPRQEVFDLGLIPPEWVTPVTDPLTGQWQQLVIRHPVTVTDIQGRTVNEYMESGLISVDAAAEFMREFIPTMLPYADPDADDDERRRVAKSFTLMQRMQDGQGLEPGEGGGREGEA